MRTRSLPVVDFDAEPIATGQWYALCRAPALKRAPLRLRRLGRELVLWRDVEGAACVAEARCPHRGADLGLGRVRDGELECPYHGFRFDGSGACTAMPCEGSDARAPGALRLSMLTSREEAGFIWLWHARADETPGPIPWVPGAPVPGPGSVAGELAWPVRFSRVMEGMLDMHHVPFAHRYVNPPGFTRLDPYEVSVQGGVVRTRGTLRREKSSRGLDLELNVAYPGMIHINFHNRIQGIAICTPIDGDHTFIALIYEQQYLRIPGLRKLIAWLLIQGELRLVQPDDLRILATTRPRTAGLRSNVLVHADRGLAEWHKLHARALSASAPPAIAAPAAPSSHADVTPELPT